MTPGDARTTAHDALSRLAVRLEEAGWGVQYRQGLLKVVNRSAPALSERITIQGEAFCWSWGQPIAQLENIAEAVEKVGFVLRTPVSAGDCDG